MDYVQDFGLYPKSDEKPLKVSKEGSNPTNLHFVKSTWAKVKRDGFGEETKKAVAVVQARKDEGLN